MKVIIIVFSPSGHTLKVSINKIVGVDLGINFIVTTYDSLDKTTFYNGKAIKFKRGRYKLLRKQLQI